MTGDAAIRTPEGRIYYAVFDDFTNPDAPYTERLKSLEERIVDVSDIVWVMPYLMCDNADEAYLYWREMVKAGEEGIVLRAPDSMYKSGRSTLKQQYLLKYKQLEESEAQIIDMVPLQKNLNPQEQDAFGLAKRSTRVANKHTIETLGAFVVLEERIGRTITFNIGTGFTEDQRALFWESREEIIGKYVRYKYQPSIHTRPRFPVFLAFRDSRDLGEP